MRYLSKINTFRDIKGFSEEELKLLAEEIRQEIIRVVSQNGGHLGSNLGVVELTLALHYVFDADKDIFVWDVSNQTYTHKILTGRKEFFHTIRCFGGLSGFANRFESPYDPFTAGHAGVSISTALGMACADGLLSRKRKIITIIGDGAMTCGIAYEALNNCGALKKDLLVILNDNRMSISPTVGAFSKYLNILRTAPFYDELKLRLRKVLEDLPLVGIPIEHILERAKNSLKTLLGLNIFTALGFQYYGPIDGHDLGLLIKTLRNIKHQERPVLLHVVTKKGKGFARAEEDPVSHHGVSPKSSSTRSYTDVFAEGLKKLAWKDHRIVAITAAMMDGTGLGDFQKCFPERFFDVGICEQHAVALAAGLANAGLRPVVAIYSTFLQRAYDQVFQEVCLQNLPIVLALDRAGFSGQDGATHHGLFDIAYLRTYPQIVLMSPKDATELQEMLEFALGLERPSAIRYPRAKAAKIPSSEEKIKLGKGEILTHGKDGAILAYGSMVELALEVSKALRGEGIEISVANARFAKPIDTGLTIKFLREHPFVLTIEEHAICGGFGSSVLEALSGISSELHKLRLLGIPDRFIEHGEREKLLEAVGLTVKGVIDTIKRLRAS
jgi:1-deoxy-D-xylulose-5-phosphate synthase